MKSIKFKENRGNHSLYSVIPILFGALFLSGCAGNEVISTPISVAPAASIAAQEDPGWTATENSVLGTWRHRKDGDDWFRFDTDGTLHAFVVSGRGRWYEDGSISGLPLWISWELDGNELVLTSRTGGQEVYIR